MIKLKKRQFLKKKLKLIISLNLERSGEKLKTKSQKNLSLKSCNNNQRKKSRSPNLYHRIKKRLNNSHRNKKLNHKKFLKKNQKKKFLK